MKPAIDIASFLKGLSTALINSGVDLGVVQFGSSIVQRQFSNGLDIDLMLLSSSDCYKGNFSRHLSELKRQMVFGEFSEGFKVQDIGLAEVVAKYVDNQQLANINFIPCFVFGPIGTPLSNDKSHNVYLHFKGPITPNQFVEFSNLFPFHARSILNSSKKLAGQFDHQLIELQEKCLEKDFRLFSDALAVRVTLSEKPIEIRKCLRKLMQNLSILNGGDFPVSTSIIDLLYDRFGMQINDQQDTLELQNLFFELKERTDNYVAV